MKITTFKIEKTINSEQVTLFPTVVQVKNKNFLIDCGYEETFNEFATALETIGISLQGLHAIIISHDDIDHLGALHLFKKANKDLQVYCSLTEEPSVSGKVKAERLIQAENSLEHLPENYKEWAKNFISQLNSIQRVPVDQTLRENDRILDEMVVIDTPGHTKGHISIYIPSENTVIANDAIVIEGEELNIANPQFTLDLAAAINSIEKIRDLKPLKLICYHGGILTVDLENKMNNLLAGYNQVKNQFNINSLG
jgi:glyoxylase-like metal-dependent hydrolase (beta-lactamase superfamily II)